MKILNRGIVSSLLFASVFITYNMGISFAQIVPNPAYTTVTTNPVTGHTEIRSNYPINGGTAILNRFTQFNLPAGDTAQMYLGPQPGAMVAVNVVSDLSGTPSQIMGTLNLRLGNTLASPVGGNLIFVDPNGIIVGPAGSINAGSIMLSTSKQTLMELQPSADPNNPQFININDPAEDAKLATQNINFLGMWRLNQVTNGINIMGTVDAKGIGLVIPSQGVLMIGSDVTVGSAGTVKTVLNSKAGIITSQNTDFNPSDTFNPVKPTLPLNSGGKISIDGTLDVPGNNVALKVNTLDIVNNVVNINGLIDASALSVGNGSGGNVFIEMFNPNIQPLAGGVIFDGTGGIPSSPRGHIMAQGSNDGAGGSLTIVAPRIEVINNGGINLMSGITGLQGGMVRLVANTGINKMEISPASTAFIDGDALQSIYTVNSTTPPGSSGVIMIDDNPNSPGIYINDSFILNPNTNIVFKSASDITVDNSAIIASGNIVFNGNNYVINQSTIESSRGLVDIKTATGLIQISSFSTIQACNNNINIMRTSNTGRLGIISDGEIKAWDGENVFGIINFGNDMNITNSDPIVLSGSTFGTLANSYSQSQTIPLGTTYPSFVGQNVVMNIAEPPPPPSDNVTIPPTSSTPTTTSTPTTNADIPQDTPVATTDENTSTTNNLTVYNKKKEEVDKNVQDSVATAINNIPLSDNDLNNLDTQNNLLAFNIYDNDTSSSSDVYNGDYSKIDIKSSLGQCKGSKCDNLFNSNSVGGKIVDTLFQGYPAENEFSADNNGVKFAIKNNYSPTGLEHFLKSIKTIEQNANSAQSHSNANSLFSYKHPPTNTRITKINKELKQVNENDSKWKTNKTEFESIIDEIND